MREDNIEKLVKELLEKDKDIIVKVVEFPEKSPEFDDFKFKNSELNELLIKLGFKLYKHQVDALRNLYSGKNIILTTPTASGKSEVFRLAIIDDYLSNNSHRYLLIYPTRALLYDQYEKFLERLKLLDKKLSIDILLGDLTQLERRKVIQKRPNIILTTPDTLHLTILRNHFEFSWLFRNLRFIVIDELHSYKGVFGTNAAYVFRRLFRLTELYYKNKNYQIICLSATLRNPVEFAEKLLGKENFVLIDKGTHASPRKYLFIIDPSEKYHGFQYLKILSTDLLRHRIKSLIFLETKRSVEKMKIYFLGDDFLPLVEAYKGSYTRERRREIERRFKEGEVLILFTTSALELGIDIGDVQAVINYGVPPDGLFSLIQRFGRAARVKEGLNVLVLRNDALDAYYKENVDELIERIKKNLIEEIPVNLSNKQVVRRHLLYCLLELKSIPIKYLNKYELDAMEELKNEGLIEIRKNWFLNEEEAVLRKPLNIRYVGIRNISEDTYFLLEYKPSYEKAILRTGNLYRLVQFFKAKGIILEEVDRPIFYEQLLPGMIYYSGGKQYRVKKHLLLGKFNFVFLERFRSPYPLETKPIFREDVQVIEIYDRKKVFGIPIYLGKLRIKRYYEGYILKTIKRERDEYSYLGEIHYYDEPYVYTFETKGIWMVLPKELKEVEDWEFNYFYKKLERYLDKLKRKDLLEYVRLFVQTIDKEELYARYRGAASKKLKQIIKNFLERYGIEVEKHKKMIFLIKKLVDSYYAFQSGLHAIEHNVIKISPTVTNVDSRELGGYSYEVYRSESMPEEIAYKPVIFIYEGYENGVGLAEILYENIEKLLIKSKERLERCKCLDGCPRCVLSPKCGNSNEFLDKYAGRFILKKIVQ